MAYKGKRQEKIGILSSFFAIGIALILDIINAIATLALVFGSSVVSIISYIILATVFTLLKVSLFDNRVAIRMTIAVFIGIIPIVNILPEMTVFVAATIIYVNKGIKERKKEEEQSAVNQQIENDNSNIIRNRRTIVQTSPAQAQKVNKKEENPNIVRSKREPIKGEDDYHQERIKEGNKKAEFKEQPIRLSDYIRPKETKETDKVIPFPQGIRSEKGKGKTLDRGGKSFKRAA